jgi:hypothetical protein
MNCKEVGFACGNFVAVMIIGTIMSSQLVLALQSNGASIIAPGQLNGSDSQSANAISLGAQEKAIPQHGTLPGGGCLASSLSPGHLFNQEPTTTEANP